MKRNLWAWGVPLVYALFATSTLGFVAFAMTQPVDLVRPDYYQQSLVEDRRIAGRANARSLGTSVAVTVDREGRSLIVDLPGTRVEGSITLYRPSSSSADRTWPLRGGVSRQAIPIDDVASGRWVAQLEWSADGRPYYHEVGVHVP